MFKLHKDYIDQSFIDLSVRSNASITPSYQRIKYIIDALTYINIVIEVMCILALVCALVSLHRRKYSPLMLHNQKLILTNLCVVEILTMVVFLKIQTYAALQHHHYLVEFVIEHFFRFVLSIQYPLTMHQLTIDRFLEIYLHLRYPLVIDRRLTAYVVVATWLVSVVVAMVIMMFWAFYSTTRSIMSFVVYVVLALDLSVLGCAICTYFYLYTKYKKLTRIHDRNSFKSKFRKGKFRIPLLIILTYVFFEVTATLFTMTRYHAVNTAYAVLYRKISLVLYGFGYLADGSIYIFFRKSLSKKKIRKKCCFCCCRRRRVVEDISSSSLQAVSIRCK